MEAGFIVLVAVLFAVLCFVSGVITGKMRNKTDDSQGILNVDCSDPADGAYLYLELNVPIAEVADRKRATFDVRIIH